MRVADATAASSHLLDSNADRRVERDDRGGSAACAAAEVGGDGGLGAAAGNARRDCGDGGSAERGGEGNAEGQDCGRAEQNDGGGGAAAPADPPHRVRFMQLQKFLRSCDESDYSALTTSLLSMSAWDRSQFAAHTEKRALQLGAEEGSRDPLIIYFIFSITQKEEDLREFAAEMTTMIHLHGTPGLVQLREIFDDDLAVHLVMEFCQGGDYFDHIARKKRLSEGEAANIFRQVVVSVNAMHAKGFVHRDLKPENILIAKPASHSNEDVEVKIADFGLAIAVNEGKGIKGVVGSPFYMAPEVIKGKLYGVEVDVWSLGVILYTSLAGVLPFWGKGHQAVFTAICRAQPDFDRSPWPLISTEAKHLIRRMLTLDPTKRIRACDILEHPWMKSAHANGAPRRRSSLLRKVFGDISVQWPANLIPGISGLGGAAPAPAPASTPADLVAASDDSKAKTPSADGHAPPAKDSASGSAAVMDATSDVAPTRDSDEKSSEAVVPIMVPAPVVKGYMANNAGSGTAALRALKPVPNQSRENGGVTAAGVPRFNALKAACIGAENHPPAGQQVLLVEPESAPRECPTGGISVDIKAGCVFSNDSSDGCSDSTVYSDGSAEVGEFSSDDSNPSQLREEFLPSPRTPPSRRSGAAKEREIVGNSHNGQKNRQIQNNHQLAHSIAHPFPGLYACPNSPSFTPSPSAIAGANGGHQLGPFASGVGFCWPAGIFSPPDNVRGSMCLPDQQQQQASPMSPSLPPEIGFPELQPLPPTLHSALGSESALTTLPLPMPSPVSSHGFVMPGPSQADAAGPDAAHLMAVPSISDGIPVSPSQLSPAATLSSVPESVALEIDLGDAGDCDGDDGEGGDPVTEMAADAVSGMAAEMAEDAVSEMGTGSLEDLLAAALAFDCPSSSGMSTSASPASSASSRSSSSSSSDVSAAFSLGSSKLSWTGFNPPALPALPSPAPLPAAPAWPPNAELAPLRHEVSLDPQGTPVLEQAGVDSPSPSSAGGLLVASPGSLVAAPCTLAAAAIQQGPQGRSPGSVLEGVGASPESSSRVGAGAAAGAASSGAGSAGVRRPPLPSQCQPNRGAASAPVAAGSGAMARGGEGRKVQSVGCSSGAALFSGPLGLGGSSAAGAVALAISRKQMR
ncbi:unnamed protein product [Closterium sp. Yama58-4]|nr:unnamed protein product [Closterium sp. Yama58-4]